jgi:hypothetical protein
MVVRPVTLSYLCVVKHYYSQILDTDENTDALPALANSQKAKKMAKETKKITQKHLETQSHDTENLKAEFIKLSEQIRIKHARALTGFGTPNELQKRKEKKRPAKPLTPGPLGQYLLHIAKLYNAMDVEPDVRLLRDHLFQNPPLHALRTLDQSYYWKLPNTDGKDQDQVVYRETKEGKNILRTTRVVMVDQLWMYILDNSEFTYLHQGRVYLTI